jgi:hypothetical protein
MVAQLADQPDSDPHSRRQWITIAPEQGSITRARGSRSRRSVDPS